MIAAAALAMALVAATDTTGTGWRIAESHGVTHLDTTGWSFQFYDDYSLQQAAPYAKLTAAELELHTGVDMYVGTTVHAWDLECPGYTSTGRHRIIIKIDPAADRAHGSTCNTPTGAAESSLIVISDAKWKSYTRNGSNEIYRRGVISHESGHSVGLSHPDWTGTEHNSSLCTLAGTDPLMCGAYWGGYQDTNAHKFASYDISGLKHLVLNRP